MPLSIADVRKIVKPWRLFLAVMACVFVVEAVVMASLPLLISKERSFLVQAIVDALLLTIILAPILWRIVIHPLQTLVNVRTKLLRHVLSAQEDERARIARDLHDGLGQSLTSLLVGLRAVEEMTGDERVRRHLADMRRIASDTHDEIRRLARGLRPSVLDDVGLEAAIDRFCDDVKTASGGRVTVRFERLGEDELSSDLETACFRIVQEATTNAIRHGAASQIQLRLNVRSDSLELQIQDDGRGFDSTAVDQVRGRFDPTGLWTIRERVELLGGALRVESHPNAGTLVDCQIPLSKTEHADNGEDPSVGGR